ncbi:MAG: terminase small subunit [Sulfuricaulis sp.]
MEEYLKDLKPAHATFVAEYLKNGGNATAAYHVAYPGSDPESAKTLGSRLYRKVHIGASIAAGQKIMNDAVQAGLQDAAKHVRQGITLAGITKERVLVEMARMGFANLGDVLNDDGSVKPFSEMTEDEQRGLAAVEMQRYTDAKGNETVTHKVKTDKVTALDRLMKHLGLYEKDNEQLGRSIALAFKVEPKDKKAA